MNEIFLSFVLMTNGVLNFTLPTNYPAYKLEYSTNGQTWEVWDPEYRIAGSNASSQNILMILGPDAPKQAWIRAAGLGEPVQQPSASPIEIAAAAGLATASAMFAIKLIKAIA